VNGLKAAGWIPGGQIAEAAILGLSAMVAGGTTYGIGTAAVKYFQSDRKVDVETLRTVFDAAAWSYKKQTEGA